MLMFEMSLDVAEEFYKRCAARKATTDRDREAILLELAKEGKILSVMETKRTPDQVAKDMAKNFGKVLLVKAKKKGKDNGDKKS